MCISRNLFFIIGLCTRDFSLLVSKYINFINTKITFNGENARVLTVRPRHSKSRRMRCHVSPVRDGCWLGEFGVRIEDQRLGEECEGTITETAMEPCQGWGYEEGGNHMFQEEHGRHALALRTRHPAIGFTHHVPLILTPRIIIIRNNLIVLSTSAGSWPWRYQ